MQEKEKGDELSQATSQSDHRSSNARAKEESPKAPGPVIGMNDERGGVSIRLLKDEIDANSIVEGILMMNVEDIG